MSGKRRFGTECNSEHGELMYANSDDYTHIYKYNGIDRKCSCTLAELYKWSKYMSSLAVPDAAKLLYLDSDFMLEMECKSTLVNGACPPQHASFFVFARAHVTTQELRTRFVQEIKKRTHGCFEVDLSLAEKNGKSYLSFSFLSYPHLFSFFFRLPTSGNLLHGRLQLG